MKANSPRASLVITTKNRKNDLRKAIASALRQTEPLEVLVMDDGSTDGTEQAVRREFPDVQIHRTEVSHGYIVQRNRGARLARGSVIFSLDDDAIFSTPNIVEQTLADFVHARVGAVAIPHLDINKSRTALARTDRETILVIASFTGCAAAVRRDLFLELGGYHEYLFHQCEEPDFCMRLLARGYVTRVGSAEPIHHFVSPRRDSARQFIHNARNNLLNAWYNVPMPFLPMHWCGTLVNLTIRDAIQEKHPIWMMRGVARLTSAIWHERAARRPVPRKIYRLSRRIVRSRGGLPLYQVEPSLTPLPTASVTAVPAAG